MTNNNVRMLDIIIARKIARLKLQNKTNIATVNIK